MDFEVLWLLTKVFSAKCGGMVSSGSTIGSTSEQAIRESFLHQSFFAEILFFHQFVKVSPTEVSRCTVPCTCMYTTGLIISYTHVHNRVKKSVASVCQG